ncbi:MAG: hypothetical protein ACR2OU_05005 [Thermomicrobiales bacterium]
MRIRVRKGFIGIQVLPYGNRPCAGPAQITQCYFPAKGWEKGTYSFEVVVSSVSNGAETVLATVPIESTIAVP